MSNYDINIIRKKYALVPRTLVFIEKENQILLLKKKVKDSFGYGKINGVGGHIEKGEEPFEAALREVHEETAMTVDNLKMIAMIFIDINDVPGILLYLFKADHVSGNSIKSSEGELIWMTRSEIRSNNLVIGDIPFLIEICDNHEDGNIPEIFKYIYNEKDQLRIVKRSY